MIRVALVAIALTGCLRTTSFHCATDSDCRLAGAQGTCEAVGYCAFSDSTCTSGLRFGDLSASYANQCVGDQPGDDASTDGPHDAHVFHDAPPASFCDTTSGTLAACWEFEGNLNDGSGHNNNATGTLVTYAAGKVGMARPWPRDHIHFITAHYQGHLIFPVFPVPVADYHGNRASDSFSKADP